MSGLEAPREVSDRLPGRAYKLTEARARALENARRARTRKAKERQEEVAARDELRGLESEFREFRRSDLYRSGRWREAAPDEGVPDEAVPDEGVPDEAGPDEGEVIFV